MSKLEQAARQALDALESAPVKYDFNSYPMLVMTPDTLQTTLTALREALAEQEEQEPVGEVVLRNQTVGFGRTEERKDIVFLADVEVGTKLYAAPVRTKDLTVSELDAIIEKHYDDEMDLKAMILDGIAADRELNK